MADIKIDYDGLSQQAAALKNCASSYEQLCSRLKNMTEQISSTWEGEASSAFVEMMRKYYQQGLLVKDIIETARTYADSTGSTFQTLDQECAALIRNSF